MEMKLELVAIPVTDVDRARDFYKDKVGFNLDFNLDYDQTVSKDLRFVQMTPLGSACSICFGIGIADNMKPGSIKGLQMVVKDAQAAHDELKKRGVDVTDIDIQVWGKFVHFNDPDGNAWTLQELPPRRQFKV
jgi:catechol 2,3-dioxygenase-like lactoylglutathione lyase family enzyme